MDETNFISFKHDGFSGKARPEWLAGLTEGRLAGLRTEVTAANKRVLARRRHQVVVIDFKIEGKMVPVAVKHFGKQQGWKDRYDLKRGSKAARSFQAAVFLATHGVATPPPLAYFERWEGAELVESFYLSAYLGELTSFKVELLRLYESSGPCAALIHLLEDVGTAMRRMHDAGFYHRDLGNQNIELLSDKESGERSVYFIDLNRGRIREELSIEERARDFARLTLPSAFLDILTRIYWQSKAPTAFNREVAKQRSRFLWWQRSRLWRHPINQLKKSKRRRDQRRLHIKDVWIWDDRSAQAAVILNQAERKKCHSWVNNLKIAYSSLKALPGVKRYYTEQLKEAFSQPVTMADKIGMSLEPADMDFDQQFDLLGELGSPMPVLIRIGHHQGKDQWDRSLQCLERLRAAGHGVTVAVLQDRKAVLEPEWWSDFLNYLFPRLEGKVELVEVGHVVNRVKWGIHNLKEYRVLMQPLVALKRKYPGIQIAGPACIDFEMHHTVAALDHLPEGLHFDAVAHHLYVDRRGAPENKQGRFGTVEKAALLKAVALHSGKSSSRVVVSEVNWPLEDTGVWSPVAASYQLKGAKGSRVHVTEEQYGTYMIRYLALVLCSGLVERVFWWRLAAHGFGLVDERIPGGWRKRVGFKMLATFLKVLGAATFIEKLPMPEDVYAMRFQREHDEVTLIWCNGRTHSDPSLAAAKKILNAEGNEIETSEVGEAPLYLFSKDVPRRRP